MRSDTHRSLVTANTGYLVQSHLHHSLLCIYYVQSILHPLLLKLKQILERNKACIISTFFFKDNGKLLFLCMTLTVFRGDHWMYLNVKVWNKNRRAKFLCRARGKIFVLSMKGSGSKCQEGRRGRKKREVR